MNAEIRRLAEEYYSDPVLRDWREQKEEIMQKHYSPIQAVKNEYHYDVIFGFTCDIARANFLNIDRMILHRLEAKYSKPLMLAKQSKNND